MRMVVQKTIDNLKNSPKEDKVAVASGIAVSVVVVLFAAWAIFFIRNLQKTSGSIELSGGAQDQFNFTSVKEAQEQLQRVYGSPATDLEELRAQSSGSGRMELELQTVQQGTQNSGPDQFGTQPSSQ